MMPKKHTVAIIGGAGKMGRWLTGFLREDGFPVVIADADQAGLAEAGRQPGVAVADGISKLSPVLIMSWSPYPLKALRLLSPRSAPTYPRARL